MPPRSVRTNESGYWQNEATSLRIEQRGGQRPSGIGSGMAEPICSRQLMAATYVKVIR
jgi:hypothetical protein